MKREFLRPASSKGLSIETKVCVEDAARFPRSATIYAVKELARRAGVSAAQFQSWRIEFEESGFTNVFVLPGSQSRFRFPQAKSWFWKDLDEARFHTSTAAWLHRPEGNFGSIPNFKIPFSSDSRADVGPLFNFEGKDCVSCPVDLPSSVLLTLSRFEETFPGPRDDHGRFSARSSIAWREGFLHRPIVDEYGVAFERALSFLMPGWKPLERKLRIKFGHDVDEIGVPFSLRNVVGHTVRRRMPQATIRDLAALCSGLDTTYEMLLRRLVSLSLDQGLRPAVYWKATAPRSSKPCYDLNHPRIRRIIADFRARGVEMGVHPSYESFDSFEALQSEVSTIRQALGDQHVGGRQDFLRWSPESWVRWDRLGLAYDATVGFADCIGFRAGTCYPFHPWLLSQNRRASLVEIPLMAMDSTLLGYMQLSPQEALERLFECVERCRIVGGVFSLLWHNTRLIGNGYSTVFRGLLEKLVGSESYYERALSDGRFWN